MLEQRLEQALANWEKWAIKLQSKPSVICELTGGLTNHSYMIISGNKQMVLRLNAENSHELGINRHHEKTILNIVSKAGIAPAVYYCSPDEGVLVTELIEGMPLDITAPESIQRLHLLFEQVHRLKPDIPIFDYQQHISQYRCAVGDNEPLPPQLEKAVKVLQTQSGQGLCHHDPSVGNVIERQGQLYLLDWEYAGLGAVQFDNAAIRAEWSGYCVLSKQSTELEHAAESIYQYLCYLWSAINK